MRRQRACEACNRPESPVDMGNHRRSCRHRQDNRPRVQEYWPCHDRDGGPPNGGPKQSAVWSGESAQSRVSGGRDAYQSSHRADPQIAAPTGPAAPTRAAFPADVAPACRDWTSPLRSGPLHRLAILCRQPRSGCHHSPAPRRPDGAQTPECQEVGPWPHPAIR